jgi:hypothetical protein
MTPSGKITSGRSASGRELHRSLQSFAVGTLAVDAEDSEAWQQESLNGILHEQVPARDHVERATDPIGQRT